MYNGNISSMRVNIGQLNQPQLYNYEYDQLNRLVSMQAYRGFNGNSWNGITATSDHQEQISYDGNGNITAYLRNGNTSAGKPLAMDNLGYHYKDSAGIRLSNQLIYVSDAVTANTNYTEDIDGHTDSANCHYDQIGNLIKDSAEKISNIEWNVYGKIAQIWKENSPSVGELQRIRYSYDASGNRISKTVYSNQDAGNYKAVHTWYVRDASGNVMATYTSEDVAAKSTLATGTMGKLYLSELHMYGSSRLGIWNRKVDMDVLPASGGEAPLLGSLGIDTFNRGNKFFELANHLGNVLVSVSDRKVGQNPVSGLYTSYTSEVVSASDYAPFGMQMVGRTFSAGAYRYGFNGKENDNEVKGEGNQQDYGERIYDVRIGKFLSIDPLTEAYPMLTPYQFASNRPIDGVDEDGLEWRPVVGSTGNVVDYEWAGFNTDGTPKNGTVGGGSIIKNGMTFTYGSFSMGKYHSGSFSIDDGSNIIKRATISQDNYASFTFSEVDEDGQLVSIFASGELGNVGSDQRDGADIAFGLDLMWGDYDLATRGLRASGAADLDGLGLFDWIGPGELKMVAAGLAGTLIEKESAKLLFNKVVKRKQLTTSNRNITKVYSSRKRAIDARPKPSPQKPGQGQVTKQMRNKAGEGKKFKTDRGKQTLHIHDKNHNKKSKKNIHYRIGTKKIKPN